MLQGGCHGLRSDMCGALTQLREMAARTLLLPSLQFSSCKLSCHRELCVPCLLLMENGRCLLCNVCFREGWRSVPVLLCGSVNDKHSQHGAFGRQRELPGTFSTTVTIQGVNIHVTEFKHAVTDDVCSRRSGFQVFFCGVFLLRHLLICFFFFTSGWLFLSDGW